VIRVITARDMDNKERRLLRRKQVDRMKEELPSAKSPISIRLVSEQIASAKKIAASKSVCYQTQLRMWIAEGIQREMKGRQPVSRGR